MFWRKKKAVAVATVSEAGGTTPLDITKAEKEKPLKPKKILAEKIEQLHPGETLKFKLPEVYGDELIVIQINPAYPGSGKKYSFGAEKLNGGNPSGKITYMWDSNNPIALANWVLERNGQLFS